MDYYLIKGHFHVVGYSPDGDSLMFEASSDKHWDKLQSQYQDVFAQKLEGGNGSVQLRLQGIDRLVKHQFRRQMEGYWDAVANEKGFEADPDDTFLDTFFHDTNPYVFLINERDFIRLDNIVQVSKTKLKMKASPENIVFLS